MEGPEVVLWVALDEEDRQSWKQAHRTSKDYVIVRRKLLKAEKKRTTRQQASPPGQCVLELSRPGGGQRGKPYCKESED